MSGNTPDPARNVAEFAMLVATFYNHLTMQGVPEESAHDFTITYISKTFDMLIAANELKERRQQITIATPDYAAIREFVIEIVKAATEGR